jgi:predicted DNA-binding protein (UPF0251 family)
MPAARCYAPQCSPNEQEEIVSLLPEELAVLDLVDLQGLEQEQAAAALGVSRKTIWRDIHEARRKVADALLHGKALEIGGCLRRQNGICPKMVGTTPAQGTDDRSPDDSGAE